MTQTGEIPVSGDEFVVAGIVNPGDNINLFWDGSPLSISQLTVDGVFRSIVPTYSSGTHDIQMRITPSGTQNTYTLSQSIRLNRIVIFGAYAVGSNGQKVRDERYFYPAQGERAHLDFNLEASEEIIGAVVFKLPIDMTVEPMPLRVDELGPKLAGQHFWEWNGKDDYGNLVAPSKYRLEIIILPDGTSTGAYAPSVLFVRIDFEVK